MLSAAPSRSTWLVEAIRRLGALEHALVEAHYAAARSRGATSMSLISACAGAAQAHMFDLSIALRDLGEPSLSYWGCVRDSSPLRGTPVEVLSRLEHEHLQILQHDDLTFKLRFLLRSHLAEHRRLCKRVDARAAMASS